MKSTLTLLLLCLSLALGAQSIPEVDRVFTLDGYNDTDHAAMVLDDAGNTYISVNYSMALKVPELKTTYPYGKHQFRLVVKLDKKGKAVWGRGFESAFDGRIRAMALAPNGDLLIAGFCDGVATFPSAKDTLRLGRDKGTGEYHQPQFLFLTRYSPKGERIWAKVWSQSWGDVGGLAVNTKGEIIWSFYHKGTLKDGDTVIDELPGDANYQDRVSILRLDGEGNILGRLPLRYTNSEINPMSVTTDAQNNILVYGMFRGVIHLSDSDSLSNDSYKESKDSFVAKYTPDGRFLWSRQLGGRNVQRIHALEVDKRGSIFFAGEYAMECVISQGITPLDTSRYEWKSGNSFFYGCFLPNGQLDFVKFHDQEGYNASCTASAMALDSHGNAYIAGHFNNALDFGSTVPAIQGEASQTSSYLSVWRRDSLMALHKHIGSTRGWAGGNSLSIRGEHLAMAGSYYGDLSLESANGKAFKLSNRDHGRNTYVAGARIVPQAEPSEADSLSFASVDHLQYLDLLEECLSPEDLNDGSIWVPLSNTTENTSSATIAVDEPACGVRLENCTASLFPNPTRSTVTLRLEGFSGLVTVEIISDKGDLLLSQRTEVAEHLRELQFNVSALAPATYFVRITQQGYRRSLRLVKVS